MNCARCGNTATFVPQYNQYFCGTCNGYVQAGPPSPAQIAEAQRAQRLVNLSHIFGWGGLAMMFIGPVVLGVLGLGANLAIGSAVLGIISAVVGAIIGQIGRAGQGRVI